MIVYLDQNKWIELSRIFNGKNKTNRAKALLKEIKASVDLGYIYPLSAFHYMEFARVSNLGRRKRLGSAMWSISCGNTLVSSREIVLYEIESSVCRFFPEIKPRQLELLGKGVAHAFGEYAQELIPYNMEELFERSLLTGSEMMNIEPVSFFSQKHRETFMNHLESLHKITEELPINKCDDMLYAIVTADVIDPLSEVFIKNNLPLEALGCLGIENMRELIDQMPTRRLDLHLHRQVLRNKNYKPKLSHLEDWSGLGIGACYCDVLVCEKHFADMLNRDGFQTHARVTTSIYDIFEFAEK